MDLLKALKRTTYLSAAILLALGATEASAANDTSVLGHISASLQGTLSVTENNAINFGNFSLGAGAQVGDASMTLTEVGNRTVTNGTDVISLLVGVDSGNNDSPGVADGSNLGTGGQAPGFYTITNGDSITNVYVSFAQNTGEIIDSNHPASKVTLDGPVAGAFTVDSFTWESDDGTTGYDGDPNTDDTNNNVEDGNYGRYIACGASCTIRVGATMHTVAAKTPTPGKYTGTYFMMVSY